MATSPGSSSATCRRTASTCVARPPCAPGCGPTRRRRRRPPTTPRSWTPPTAGDPDKPARNTVDGYREHLQRLFVLDPVEAWTPAFVPLKRLTSSVRHHLVDPALAARLVGVGTQGLLVGKGETVSPTTGTWLGALFESLAVQSVRVYADAMSARVGHLRTKNGDHEIDIIVETTDTRCTAIEVKLADTIHDADVRHLLWLRGTRRATDRKRRALHRAPCLPPSRWRLNCPLSLLWGLTPDCGDGKRWPSSMIGPTSAHIGEQLGDECRFEGDLFRLHCGHEQAWVPGK